MTRITANTIVTKYSHDETAIAERLNYLMDCYENEDDGDYKGRWLALADALVEVVYDRAAHFMGLGVAAIDRVVNALSQEK